MYDYYKLMDMIYKFCQYIKSGSGTLEKSIYLIIIHSLFFLFSLQLSIFVSSFISISNDPVLKSVIQTIFLIIIFYVMEIFFQIVIERLNDYFSFMYSWTSALSIIYHLSLIISSFIFIILIGIKDSLFNYIFYCAIPVEGFETIKYVIKINYDLVFFSAQSIFLCVAYFSRTWKNKYTKKDNN